MGKRKARVSERENKWISIFCERFMFVKYKVLCNGESQAQAQTQAFFPMKCVRCLYSPGNRKSLRCSKHLAMSLCTTWKNIFMFQSELNSFAFVTVHSLIVCIE